MKIVIYSIISDHEAKGKIDDLLFELMGLNESTLFTIYFEDILAVVSNIDKETLKINEANAFLFADIIEKLSQHFTVLPMRFGSLMETRDAVCEMLERNYPAFKLNLAKVQDSSEFGMKIVLKDENMDAFSSAHETVIIEDKIVSEPIEPMSVFKEYVQQKLMEHRREEKLINYIESLIASINQSISPLTIFSKFKKIVRGSYLMDAVFLVEKKQRMELMKFVEKFQKDHPELNFIVTGPWPPYSFVDITIK